MKRISNAWISGRLLLVGWCLAAVCFAQGDRGLLTGLVKDSSGALVAGATVRAVNIATGVAITSQTNTDGNYSLDFLPTGEYTVTADAAGFKQFERTGIAVRVNDRLTLNIVLEVGAATERITVSGEAPLLETTSTSLGTVI